MRGAGGLQAALVASAPEAYFVPPYVGHRGWLGVRLDRGLPWEEVAGVIEDAYATVAPAGSVNEASALSARRGSGGRRSR